MNNDLDGKIAMQANAIVGEAMREAFKWKCRDNCGVEYVPSLFLMPDAEPPVATRVGLPRIEGAARRDGRR